MQNVVHSNFNTISMYQVHFIKVMTNTQLNQGEISVPVLIGIRYVFQPQNLHQLGKEMI